MKSRVARSHRATIPLLVPVLMFTACTDAPVQPLTPKALSSEVPVADPMQASTSRAEEGMLRRASASLPEFGGFFFDTTGTLVVYLTDLTKAQHGVTVLNQVITAYRGNHSVRRSGAVVFRKGRFTFSELAAMRDSMTMPVLNLPDVVWTDLDESRNRLVVGVQRMSAAREVEHVLASLGIPAAAVIIEKTEPPVSTLQPSMAAAPPPSATTLTLQSEISPKGGGLELYQRTYAVGSVCSFGFSAKTPAGNQVFVTTSSCTNTTWGSDPADFYQPNWGGYVGTESSDPAGKYCYGAAYVKCRSSDAALITHSYMSSSYFSLGLVYPTIDRKNGKYGSITLASHTGIIESEAAGLMVNDVLDKIGSHSGWTYGPIKKTCTDLKMGTGVNVKIYRCSLQAYGMTAWFEDRGAPALVSHGYRSPYYRFDLAGIVFAMDTYRGNGIFDYTWVSPISGIETDLGALTTY